METNQRQEAEETPLVEKMDGKTDNSEHISGSQCEIASENVYDKQPVSETCSSRIMESEGVENPPLAKRIKLEMEQCSLEEGVSPNRDCSLTNKISEVGESDSTSDKLHPPASTETLSATSQEVQDQACASVLQNIEIQTVGDSGSTDEDLLHSSNPEENTVVDPAAPAVQIETHYSTLAEVSSKAKQMCKKKSSKRQKSKLNQSARRKSDSFPNYIQKYTVVSESGSEISSSEGSGNGNNLIGQVTHSFSESGLEMNSSTRSSDSLLQSTKLFKSSLKKTKSKTQSTPICSTISKIIAKRKQDRKANLTKGLYRRKHCFTQLKKHLQMLKKKGTLKDHIANIKGKKVPPCSTPPIDPKNKDPQHTDSFSYTSIIKDASCAINIPSSSFEIIRTNPPMVQYGCIYCKTVVATKEDMFVHFWKRHAKQMRIYCQTCGYSCVARGDFEKHCQNDKHDKRNVLLNCYLCGLDASDESTFKSHMTAKHKMPFHCCVCKVFFKSNDDRVHHETTEEHISDSKNNSQTSGEVKQEIEVEVSLPAVESSAVVMSDEPVFQKMVVNEVKRQQFQCKQCFYKTRSSTVLTRHIKLRHAYEYHFLCKACNIYTLHKEGMERHIKRSKHIENAKKNNIGLLFEECIERVLYDVFPEPAFSHKDCPQGEEVTVTSTEDSYCSKHAPPHTELTLPSTPKRGRPKGNLSISCPHCGLTASSLTNLKVHIRRKHTHQYNFKCKLCNYDTVTKGDMERHCLTKKHISRVEEQPVGQRKNEIVVTIDGPKFEPTVKKKGNTSNASSEHVGTTSVAFPDLQREQPIETESMADLQSECSIKDSMDTTADGNNQVDRSLFTFSGNKCTHCSFVGDSTALEQHVKDKHARDCEYYCKACDFYALSHQDMNTHAATENHKTNHESSQSSVSLAERMACNFSEDAAKSPYQNNMGEVPVDAVQNPELNTVDVMENSVVIATEGGLMDAGQDLISYGEQNIDVIQKESRKDENRIGDIPVQECTVNVVNAESTPLESDPAETDITLENSFEECTANISGNVSTSDSIVSTYRITDSDNHFDSSIVKLKMECDKLTDSHNNSGPESKAPVTKKKKTQGGSHRESNRIQCGECGFLADGLSGLNVHISMKHPVKEKHFHCLLCGKSFFTESNLHQHLASIGHQKNEQASFEELPEGGGTFKCVKCTEPFDSEQSLFIHIKEEHEELLREVNKYIEEDTEQINREREENQGNVCKYCGKTCKSSNSMAFLAHIRTHTGSKPFKCKICHFAAAQLGDARNHVKRHLGMREYKCHVCGVAFVMRKHLNNHLLGKHGVGTPKERKFACNLCYRTFREKWSLNNHMKLHTGEKPFKCTWPTCHYSFLTASAMKDHYRTHTGEKSFLCDLCGFAGGTRHALTKHRRQHTGEKPFKCEECNFASATQSHLTRHKRVHTGEKPYMCPWCDYRSNCAENVRKHILHTGKHEGVKMYNCPKCNYGTNAPMEFRNHLKDQHKDIENPDLAYLHAGIVSKSFECRLKGLGANFVETNSRFTASSSPEPLPAKENVRSSKKQTQPTEQVQQVIIIQGYSEDYDGNITIGSSVEETAAATLQTLAMASQVARVVHITEDGQVIATEQPAHMGSIIPGEILSQQLADGTTQVVVVEAPMEETETVADPSGHVVHQVMAQSILDVSQRVHTSDSSSALGALLCAVTELGNVEETAQQQDTENPVMDESLVRIASEQECAETTEEEIQMFHEVHEGEQELQPVEVVRQVMHSSGFVTSHDPAFNKMVQGVLQFAVCDSAAADQFIKDGVTQVILNEEGTVHMVSAEGPRIIMHNSDGHTISLPEQQMRLVECDDGEISQIIVTEELARAMVQNAGEGFEGGTTHYIVTEIPEEERDSNLYSHTVIETEESADILHTETEADAQMSIENASQEVNSMEVFTEYSSESLTTKPDEEQ
ncbi:zinc finger protein 407 [Hyperolius riggenbachi]|uniref:zinc finger protein 407 n=1 Tax=Hyperolius riggenbachi TaxID=752182 RepID=UPI0035A3A3A5